MDPNQRQNICAAIDANTIIYCNVSEEQQGLWMVRDGDFQNQTKVNHTEMWGDDIITSLSVSCGGKWLLITGMSAAYVSEITKGSPPTITKSHRLYNIGGISETHWHPSCEEIIYCLADYRRIAIYNVTDLQLHGIIPLVNEEDDAITTTTLVSGSCHKLSSLSLCSANGAGLITIDYPIVPPSTAIPTNIINTLDSDMCDIISVRCADDFSTGWVDTLPMDNSQLEVEFTNVIGVVTKGPTNEMLISSMSAQHTSAFSDGFTLIVVTMYGVYNYYIPNSSLSTTLSKSGVGELLCEIDLISLYSGISNFPWEADHIRDQCRVFFDDMGRCSTRHVDGVASNLILINHPLGILVSDKNCADGTISMSQLHENPPLINYNKSCNKSLIIGLVQFSDPAHGEQQYAMLTSSGEFLLDFVDCSTAKLPNPPIYDERRPCPEQQKSLARIQEWASNKESCLHQDLRTNLHEGIRKVVSTKMSDKSSSSLQPMLKLRHDAVGHLNTSLGILQNSLRQKIAELKQLRQEVSDIDSSQKALITSKEHNFKQRLDTMQSKASSGDFCNPERLSSAVTQTLLSDSSLLSRVRIVDNKVTLQSLASEVGLNCTPEVLSTSGQVGILLGPSQSDVFKVAIADSVFELPGAALTLEGKTQADQYVLLFCFVKRQLKLF